MLFLATLASLLTAVSALPAVEPLLVPTPVEVAKRHYQSGGKDCWYHCPDSIWIDKGSPWDHWDGWSSWLKLDHNSKRTFSGIFDNGYTLTCDHHHSNPSNGECKYYHPDLLSSLLEHICKYDHQTGSCLDDLYKRDYQVNETTGDLEERTFWTHPCPAKAPGPYCDHKPENAFKRSTEPRVRSNAERLIQAKQFKYNKK